MAFGKAGVGVDTENVTEITFPSHFNKLVVTEDVVEREIASFNSWRKLGEMISYRNSYIKSGPTKVSRCLVWYVSSMEEDDKKCKVTIEPMIFMKKKTKRDMSRKFVSKCDCMRKNVGYIRITFFFFSLCIEVCLGG